MWFAKRSDQAIVKNQNSSILPNIPFTDGASIPFDDANQQKDNVALFVGSMRHPVNVDGIDQFIRCSWPKVLSSKGDAVLRVVGSGMTDQQKREWNRFEGVKAVGFVEDIDSEYRQCAFSIIPLHDGGGTKIKLVESLAYQRTCVVTPHAARGFEGVLLDNEDISVGADDREFVAKCLALFADKRKRDAMAKSGKKKVDAHFSYNAFRRIVAETVSRVASAGRAVELR